MQNTLFFSRLADGRIDWNICYTARSYFVASSKQYVVYHVFEWRSSRKGKKNSMPSLGTIARQNAVLAKPYNDSQQTITASLSMNPKYFM